MPGPMRGRMPGEKKVENPGRIFKRLMKYVMKSYGLHLVIVAVLILVSVLANVQGTMFIQSLIDDYIQPMLTAESADSAAGDGDPAGGRFLCHRCGVSLYL